MELLPSQEAFDRHCTVKQQYNYMILTCLKHFPLQSMWEIMSHRKEPIIHPRPVLQVFHCFLNSSHDRKCHWWTFTHTLCTHGVVASLATTSDIKRNAVLCHWCFLMQSFTHCHIICFYFHLWISWFKCYAEIHAFLSTTFPKVNVCQLPQHSRMSRACKLLIQTTVHHGGIIS